MAAWQETVILCYAKCERCGHEWKRRSADLPKVCPKCKSPYWNKERVRGVRKGAEGVTSTDE